MDVDKELLKAIVACPQAAPWLVKLPFGDKPRHTTLFPLMAALHMKMRFDPPEDR